MKLFFHVASSILLMLSASIAAEKNIVFFIADDMSPILGCYGNKTIKTPHMDALAADGTLFTHAYATTASCSASRSVIMTGLHNHTSGQYGHQHDTGHFSCYPNTVSLAMPQVLRKAGYRTALIGKHHVAPEVIFRFDTMLPEKTRNTVAMVESAKDIIFSKDERPFLLYLGFGDPHRAANDLKKAYSPNSFGNKENQQSWPGVSETFYQSEQVQVPPYLPDTAECRAELVEYYQSISRVDAGLGRLVELLKEAGLYEKTLIVVTSDHGLPFPGGKTTVYEAGLHVPFIVRNPYLSQRGVKNSALISHADITPSLLDFAGGLDQQKNAPKERINENTFWKEQGLSPLENRGKKYPSYHGKSWLDILEKSDDPARTAFYASHTFHEVQMYYPMRVIRDHQYKLIWNIAYQLPYPFATDLWTAPTWQAQWKKGANAPYGFKTVGQYIQRPEFELYDMKYDPNEQTNLASHPAHAATLELYKSRLKEFQTRTNDPWVTKWEYQ